MKDTLTRYGCCGLTVVSMILTDVIPSGEEEVNGLLQEDGENLLLEDGNPILLES